MSRWREGEHEAVTCRGKIRYETRAAAGKAKQRMRKKKYRDGGNRSEVNVYRCQYCGFWHLGRGFGKTAKRRHEAMVEAKRSNYPLRVFV